MSDLLSFIFFWLLDRLIHLWQYPLYRLHCMDGLDGGPLVPMWLVNLPYGSLPETWKRELLHVWRWKWRHERDAWKAKPEGGAQ
jgi:hypothetical protein